jgi:hypothetical protein
VLFVARLVFSTSERAAPALRAIALDGADPDKTISSVINAAVAEMAAATDAPSAAEPTT